MFYITHIKSLLYGFGITFGFGQNSLTQSIHQIGVDLVTRSQLC